MLPQSTDSKGERNQKGEKKRGSRGTGTPGSKILPAAGTPERDPTKGETKPVPWFAASVREERRGGRKDTRKKKI